MKIELILIYLFDQEVEWGKYYTKFPLDYEKFK